jgi:putative transposase
MELYEGFTYKLKPNRGQETAFRKYAGCARFIYNKTLAEQQAYYKEEGKHYSLYDLHKDLTFLKKDPKLAFLKEAPANCLLAALADLEQAYQRFFNKVSGHPKPKKRQATSCGSFSLSPGDVRPWHIDQANARIKLTKRIGWIRYFADNRKIPSEASITRVTVSNDVSGWYVSVATKRDVPEPVHIDPASMVGIDFGVVKLATLSSGIYYEPNASFRDNQEKLAKAQRLLSRKKKGSRNRYKQIVKVAKIHRKIRLVRLDKIEKITTDICKNHAIICVEDLQVKNLTRSASGTIEEPGKNVAQKSGLNKAILDQGIGSFKAKLQQKAIKFGCQVIVVLAHHTSQTCPNPKCGHKGPENRTSQEHFKCVKCGLTGNADHIASINVLSRGLLQAGWDALRVGQTRLACLANGALRPSATGTHRSDQARLGNAVGEA